MSAKCAIGLLLVGGFVVGVGLNRYRHPDGALAFRMAMNVDPPPGVTRIAATRYSGVLGDRVLLLRFLASEEAVRSLVSPRVLRDEPTYLGDLMGEPPDVAPVWRVLFGGYWELGGPAWRCPAQLGDPQLYRWADSDQLITLLWDRSTLEAYVLAIKG